MADPTAAKPSWKADFSKALVAILNDGNPSYSHRLKITIDATSAFSALKYKPAVSSDMVGEEIARYFSGIQLAPAMFFVDPFGYKGLTRQLISSVLKDLGSDCVFFFNYNRINQALGQDIFDSHLHSLFGVDRTQQNTGRHFEND